MWKASPGLFERNGTKTKPETEAAMRVQGAGTTLNAL